MSGKSGKIADRVPVIKSEVVPEMVKRYLAGESMTVLGGECGKSRRTIYRWFLSELGDEKYRETVTECLIARVADADEELEAARNSRDPVRVQAARETCRFVRMDLERRRPALYGPKQEVKHSGDGPRFSIVLLGQPTTGEQQVGQHAGGAVIDGTPGMERLPAPAGGAQENEEKREVTT